MGEKKKKKKLIGSHKLKVHNKMFSIAVEQQSVNFFSALSWIVLNKRLLKLANAVFTRREVGLSSSRRRYCYKNTSFNQLFQFTFLVIPS